jgi:DNA-directed RNA polymerase subunit M/transcription elongation factor TFIIS
LNNLKESINKNQIVVKDSSKVIQFCDRLSERLPKFKEESTEILSNIKHLKDENKDSPLEKIRKIENRIKENKKDIQDEILRKDDLNNQKIQEEERLKKITEKTKEQLFYLLKKRYEIKE